MSGRRLPRVTQAFVELKADDPEAISALQVARSRLGAGKGLTGLGRMRLLELSGSLPTREQQEDLMHRSTQFYNPHKERCRLRSRADDAPPLEPGQGAIVVWERGATRRAAAERWWLHETGHGIEVREAVVWWVRFPEPATVDLEDLAMVRDRRHGLFCNPFSQEFRIATAEIPIPWITSEA